MLNKIISRQALHANHFAPTTFRKVCVAFFVLFLMTNCSKQEQQVQPRLQKSDFVSLKLQAEIKKQSKVIFAKLKNSEKTVFSDSLLNDPNALYQTLLVDAKQFDSTAYNIFMNIPESSMFSQQNLYASFSTTLSTPTVNSLSSYFEKLDIEIDLLTNAFTENTVDSIAFQAISAKINEVTSIYEQDVINSPNLDNQEKSSILTATTLVLENRFDIVEIADKMATNNIQAKKGKVWRAIWCSVVSIVFNVVTFGANGYAVGALTGYFFSLSRASAVGTIIGASFGLVRAIVGIARNECWGLRTSNNNSGWRSCW
jgi:hypothetical protein